MALSFQPPGGGNGVGAWTVQALQDEYQVTILTWDPFDPEPINRYYGTRLEATRVRSLCAPAWLRRLVRFCPFRPLVMLQLSVLLRMLRQRSDQFDVLLCTHNEVDYGRPGIQYVHEPWFHNTLEHVRPVWREHPLLRLILRAYRAMCSALCGFRGDGIRRNCTVVNSRFTARSFARVYGMESRVVHPPVAGPFLSVPWENRADEFICLGRITPCKELEKVIRILDRVRALGHDVRLHLVGNADHSDYFRTIMQMARARSEWIRFHDTVSRRQLAELIGHCRYGIHGMTEEHFGMAVGEMVRGGCIVFVPDGGGQPEIVGGDPRLCYRDEADAAAKIASVITSSNLQNQLRTMLDAQKDRFSETHFMAEMSAVVREYLLGRSFSVERSISSRGPTARR